MLLFRAPRALRISVLFLAFFLSRSIPCVATNGMNLEGYGPVAAAMGGASIAFDNGTAGLMNNPATLGAGLRRAWRLDLALGMLGPDVHARIHTPAGDLDANSHSDAFFMPAAGVITRRGRATWGLGIFGQGGMGTEYGAHSCLADPSQGQNTALHEGLVNRSEVSVGRVLVPVAFQMTPRLRLGATLDLVWIGMDLQMAMSEGQFVDLASTHREGTASGSMVQAFGSMYEPFGGTGIQRLYHAYFDFTNDNDFTGKAGGIGVGGKIGVLFDVSKRLTVGATYHTQTAVTDLDTEDGHLSMAVSVDPGVLQGQGASGQYMDMDMPLTGKVTVQNFEWPAMLGVGAAYRPADRLLLALDVRYIFWSQVMDQFRMEFQADDTPANGGLAGTTLQAVLFQDWDDQTVISAGAEYRLRPRLALRGGFNYGANPVPARCVNALFPAIVETHLTLGGGYSFDGGSSVDVSLVRAFEKDQTNSVSGVESTHSQFNMQLMYSRSF